MKSGLVVDYLSSEVPVMKIIKAGVLAFALVIGGSSSNAETPDEWIALGARVHGAFGAFIPVGIKIGLDAVSRLNAKLRELTVLYYDSNASPGACFADGIAIATLGSCRDKTQLGANRGLGRSRSRVTATCGVFLWSERIPCCGGPSRTRRNIPG